VALVVQRQTGLASISSLINTLAGASVSHFNYGIVNMHPCFSVKK
jgi:hypothetical protein